MEAGLVGFPLATQGQARQVAAIGALQVEKRPNMSCRESEMLEESMILLRVQRQSHTQRIMTSMADKSAALTTQISLIRELILIHITR